MELGYFANRGGCVARVLIEFLSSDQGISRNETELPLALPEPPQN